MGVGLGAPAAAPSAGVPMRSAKNSSTARQNFVGRVGMMHGVTQYRTVAHTVGERSSELLHLPHRVGNFRAGQIPEIAGEQLIAIKLRRFMVTAGGQKLCELLKNPGISGGPRARS